MKTLFLRWIILSESYVNQRHRILEGSFLNSASFHFLQTCDRMQMNCSSVAFKSQMHLVSLRNMHNPNASPLSSLQPLSVPHSRRAMGQRSYSFAALSQ